MRRRLGHREVDLGEDAVCSCTSAALIARRARWVSPAQTSTKPNDPAGAPVTVPIHRTRYAPRFIGMPGPYCRYPGRSIERRSRPARPARRHRHEALVRGSDREVDHAALLVLRANRRPSPRFKCQMFLKRALLKAALAVASADDLVRVNHGIAIRFWPVARVST